MGPESGIKFVSSGCCSLLLLVNVNANYEYVARIQIQMRKHISRTTARVCIFLCAEFMQKISAQKFLFVFVCHSPREKTIRCDTPGRETHAHKTTQFQCERAVSGDKWPIIAYGIYKRKQIKNTEQLLSVPESVSTVTSMWVLLFLGTFPF